VFFLVLAEGIETINGRCSWHAKKAPVCGLTETSEST
jgi:hypothetical protein